MTNQITIYKNVFDTTNAFHIGIETALQRIKSGKSTDWVNQIRNCTDKEKQSQLKKQLPCVLFSGTFKTRFDNDLIQHSGFICLDFDSVTNANELKTEFTKDRFVYAVWISPSGKGVKVLVRIPSEADKHKNYFVGIQKYFDNPNFDIKTSNVSRVCYESYDVDIYINPQSETFTNAVEISQTTETHHNVNKANLPHSETYSRLITWLNKKETYVRGNRNNYLYLLASALNRYGINKDTAQTYLEIDFNGMQKEIANIVKSAYKNVNQHNTKAFDKITKHKFKVDVKIGNKGNKADIRIFFVDDLQQLTKHLDRYFSEWRWANVYNNLGDGSQLGSFTKFIRPEKPDHVPTPFKTV